MEAAVIEFNQREKLLIRTSLQKVAQTFEQLASDRDPTRNKILRDQAQELQTLAEKFK